MAITQMLGGESALRVVEQATAELGFVRREFELLEHRKADLERTIQTFGRGAEGEAELVLRVANLAADASQGWRIWADRRWPGTRRSNIDLILASPAGIFVLDAKNWRESHIDSDRLFCGQYDASDEVRQVAEQARAVGGVLLDVGLSAVEVCPVLVVLGSSRKPVLIEGTNVIGSEALPQFLLRRGIRFRPEQLMTVAAHLDEYLLPMPDRTSVPLSTAPRPPDPKADVDSWWRAAVDAAESGGIESWMTFLGPEHSRYVTASFQGPARLRGAAGTGKSVIALHRAHHLARRAGARVLMLTFSKTLPVVQKALLERLAPEVAFRVEFASLHSWALRYLRRSGQVMKLDRDAVADALTRAWPQLPADGALKTSTLPKAYWGDELSYLKRRGITTFSEYEGLARRGRGRAIGISQRREVWHLYCTVTADLAAAGIGDFDDLVKVALQALVASGDHPYTAVIVDEAQDFSLMAVRLAHQLVGDRPDGLFLVGDGEQRIYSGGFSLSDAGIHIPGARSISLTVNYRNGCAILERARALISDEDADPFDDDRIRPTSVGNVRPSGLVIEADFVTDAMQKQALVDHIYEQQRRGVQLGDIAVLCDTNTKASGWAKTLRAADIACVELTEYDGRSSAAVKVGTYHRSKGLEFASVALPNVADFDRALEPEDPHTALGRHAAYVAMTRARDVLWIGHRRSV